jgi:hypothetical protein
MIRPIFKTGPDDKLIVVDVYKNNSNVKNWYKSKDEDGAPIDVVSKLNNESGKPKDDTGSKNTDLLKQGPGNNTDITTQLGAAMPKGGIAGSGVGSVSNIAGATGISKVLDKRADISSDLRPNMSTITNKVSLPDVNKLSNPVKSLSGLTDKLKNPISAVQDGKDFTKTKSALSAASNYKDGVLSGLASATKLANGVESLANKINDLGKGTASLLNIDPKLTNKIFSSNGVRIPGVTSLSNLNNVTSIMNTMTGGKYTTTVNDTGGKIALAGNMMNIASSLKLPSGLSELIASRDMDKTSMTMSTADAINKSLVRGDIAIIKEASKSEISLDVAQSLPNLKNDILQSVKPPDNSTFNSHSDYYADVKDSMKDMGIEPYTKARGGNSTLDASVVITNTPLMETMKANVTKYPMSVAVLEPDSRSINPVVDKNDFDINVQSNMVALYGRNLSLTEQSVLKDTYNNDPVTINRTNTRDEKFIVVASQFDNNTKDSLKQQFPGVDVNTNRTTDKVPTKDFFGDALVAAYPGMKVSGVSSPATPVNSTNTSIKESLTSSYNTPPGITNSSATTPIST